MTARKPAPPREHFHPPVWVLRQPGLHPTLQSERSLVLESENAVKKLTLNLQFDARRKPVWHYRYVIRHYEDGAEICEYYSGAHGDPSLDEQIEAWVEPT